MSIVNRFATMVFKITKDSAEDEYQEQILLRAIAIAYYTIPISNYVAGAILAWSLPGMLAFFSIVMVIPLLVSELVSNNWVKGKIPRPKAQKNHKYSLAILIPAVAWIAGIAFNAFCAGEQSYATGVIAGAVGGGIAVSIFAPRILARRNAQDAKRINASLED